MHVKLAMPLYLLVAVMLIGLAGTSPCGIVNIVKEPKNLDNNTYIKAQETFTSQFNGRAITIYGWVMFKEEAEGSQPLLELRVLPNDNERGNDIPATFDPFATVYITKLEQGKSELSIKIAETAQDYRTVTVPIIIIKDKWIFFAYSADYSVDSVVVFMSDYSDINLYREVKVNYKEFSLRKRLEIDIGCAPDDKTASNPSLQCMKGKIQQFEYILDYFKNPSFLYLFATGQNRNVIFILDNYKRDSEKYVSKDATKTPYKIIKHNGMEVDTSQEDVPPKHQNKLAIYKETNVVIERAVKFDSTKFIESPTVYVKFDYTEPLTDNFLFLYLKDSFGHVVLEVHLNKSGDRRYAEIMLIDLNIVLRTPEIFVPNSKNSFSLSLIRRIDKIGLMLYTSQGSIFSSFVDYELAENYDLIFFNSKAVFGGYVQLIQVNLLESATGAVFNEFKDQYSRRNLDCASNCKYFASYEHKNLGCIDCGLDAVLLPHAASCANVCPRSTKNMFGSCGNCRTSTCPEVGLGYFAAERLSDYTIRLAQKRDINNFNHEFEESFAVSVANAQSGKNYDHTVKVVAHNDTAIYSFVSLDGFKLSGKEVTLRLKDDIELHDDSRNIIQDGATFVIPLGSGLSGPNDPDWSEKSSSNEKNAENFETNQRKERRNQSVEDSFKVLGIMGAIALWVTVLFGVLGLVIFNPYINRPKFLYQKFIQSFLIFQFMAFWVFYNAFLPHNLLGYLHKLYQLTTGWHDIFSRAARNNHGGNDGFDADYKKLVHRRFYEEDLVTHFALSFGFVLFIQALVVSLYALIKVLSIIAEKQRQTEPKTQSVANSTKVRPLWKSIATNLIDEFEWMILSTIFLMFTVEITVYAVYNLYGPSFNHPLFTFSFILAIIVLAITLALFFHVFYYPFKNNTNLLMTNDYKRNGFIFEGLRLQIFRKNFQGFQYLLYTTFSALMVVSYSSRLAQSILTYLLFISFVAYVFVMLPAESKFDKIEQIVIHALLFVTFTFLIALVFDDSAKVMNANERWVLGYFVAILSFFVIVWNMGIILYKVITYFIAIKQHKNNGTPAIKTNNEAPINIVDEDQAIEANNIEDKNNSEHKKLPDKKEALNNSPFSDNEDPINSNKLTNKGVNKLNELGSSSEHNKKDLNAQFNNTGDIASGSNQNSLTKRSDGNFKPDDTKSRNMKSELTVNSKFTPHEADAYEFNMDKRSDNEVIVEVKGNKEIKQDNGTLSFRGNNSDRIVTSRNQNTQNNDKKQIHDEYLGSDYNLSAINKPAPTILSKELTITNPNKTNADSNTFKEERFVDSKVQNPSKLESLRKMKTNQASVLRPDSDISAMWNNASYNQASQKEGGLANINKSEEKLHNELDIQPKTTRTTVIRTNNAGSDIYLDDNKINRTAYAYFKQDSDVRNNYRGF